MSIVRYVAFYPPTGWEDRPWLDDPACDALVKTARRVGELYSEEVARLRLVGKASEVRFFAEEAQVDAEAVGVDVHVDFLGGFEAVRVSVPRAVAGLEPRERAELVLEILHRSMLVLAPYRGWSVEALLSAEANARARQLEFVWTTPWKASPDRHREARATFSLADDGLGRAVVEVRKRGDDGGKMARSQTARAYSTVEGFKRSARTLRWRGGMVTMTPSVDFLGRPEGAINFDPSAAPVQDETPPHVPRLARGPRRPGVVIGSSTYLPPAPQIRFAGGGPTNGVPGAYLRVLGSLLDLVEAEGVAWWSAADRNLLRITFEITDGETGVRVRRLKDQVTATILRPLASFGLLTSPKSMAHDDVSALLAAVARHMGLGEPPNLPGRRG